MGKHPKFKIGDRVLHHHVKDTGFGTITKIEKVRGDCLCSITWDRLGHCRDHEEDLYLVNDNDIYVRFEGFCFSFPQGTDQETMFEEVLRYF